MYCKNVGKSEAERRSACADGCGLNPFSAPWRATQNRVDERVLNCGETDFMSEVEVVVDSRSGLGMGSRGVEESLADEE